MKRIDYWHTKCPYFGSRKILDKLRKEGYVIGRKKVRRLMCEMGITAIYPKINLSKRNFKEAVASHGIPSILNSDQGSQFTSDDYKKLLQDYGIRQSMDGKSRWADNIMIERWFRSLKTEAI